MADSEREFAKLRKTLEKVERNEKLLLQKIHALEQKVKDNHTTICVIVLFVFIIPTILSILSYFS